MSTTDLSPGRTRSGWCGRGAWFAAMALLALAVHPASALAQTGTVTGQVVSAQNQPMAGALVEIVGTSLTAVTSRDGSFSIGGIPVGEQQVRVEFLGHATLTRSVQVTAGVTALRLTLRTSAIALDGVVVTGRATGTARREIGSSVVGINTSDLEGAPISSASQLLQGRAPGVTILPAGGDAGQGSRIVLRGLASISQSNTPIIYVDGVRMDNSSYAGIRTTGSSWSGFDDINPADIENIEIIRGASAATLYGTEAAAGVVNITTKRGRDGEARWNFRSEVGVNNTPVDWWRESSSAYADWYHANIIQSGSQRSNQLSLSGGQAGFNYYASGTLRKNDGIHPNNGEDYGAFRTNVQVLPSENMVLGISAGYSQRKVQLPGQGNNQEGFVINGLMGGPGGWFTPTDGLRELDMFQNSSRFTGGVTLDYSMSERLSHRVVLGADVFNSDNTELLPPDVVARFSGGYAGAYRRSNRSFNLDYAATFRSRLSESVRSTTSAGFQATRSNTGIVTAFGENFPFTGLTVVGATASDFSAGESRSEERTAGFFAEQQFSINERLFVTAGARADGHSAFGADVDYQFYPKVDVSYVLSDTDLWREGWGDMRLRGAYGMAGMQPGNFTAVRTWGTGSAAGGLPAIRPTNVGNADLKPEVSTELEIGFDATVLSDRFSVEFSYYSQTTKDALYQARNIPSLGVPGTQLRNIGEIANSGFEIGTTTTVLDLPSLRWSVRANLSTNSNEIVSLGGEPMNQVRWLQYNREGFPIAGFFANNHLIMVDGQVVNKWDHLGTGSSGGDLSDADQFIGPALPTRTIQLGSDISFLENFNVNFLFDYKGGHYRTDHTFRWLLDPRRTFTAQEGVEDVGDGPTSLRCRAAAEGSLDEAICGRNSLLSHGEFAVPADFWKLRELVLTYRVPSTLAQRSGASSATVSLAGRNLWRWMKTPGLEPEANLNAQSTLQNQTFFPTPTPRQFVAGITVTF